MRTSRFIALALLLAAPLAQALPTPGLNGEVTEPVYGRIFPEALETNDYVSLNEAIAGLETLNARHPERMEIVEIGESVGWTSLVTQSREPMPIFSVEVTNEESPLPAELKRNVVFLLAVHGNEKGAREGGLRVIEDLVSDKGMAVEEPELVDLLDTQRLVFVFANSDGWTHEEAQYRANDACYVSVTCDYSDPVNAGAPGAESQNFVRVNGNGIDLNRQYPTVGYLADGVSFRTMEQPEIFATVQYLRAFPNVAAAADVHGMLNNDNFFRILLKDGAKTQVEFLEHERLAQNLKERLNSNPHYAAYQDGPVVPGAWGSDFGEWAATFDAIGYSASGTGGAFVTQHLGLNAPGFTIEQAYSHITVDNYYPGAGAFLNDYHVESMRDTVAAFMRFVAETPDLAIEGNGQRIAYLPTDVIVTNEDDDPTTYTGWWTETDRDDDYDLLHRTFRVSLNDWFTDLQPYLANGAITALDGVGDLTGFDSVVIPGSAYRRIQDDAAAAAALQSYVEAGGHLLLTDEALQLLPDLTDVPAGAVQSRDAYSGYTDLAAPGHAFAKGLKGIPRVTYDANPLGFGAGESPVWFVEADAWEKAGGETVGHVALSEGGMLPVVEAREPTHEEAFHVYDDHHLTPHEGRTHLQAEHASQTGVNLGRLKVGEGEVVIFGAILPDTTEKNQHPYGLEGYAVSVTGNRILLNVLGLGQAPEYAPITLEALLGQAEDLLPTEESKLAVPGAGAGLIGAVVAAMARLSRRRN